MRKTNQTVFCKTRMCGERAITEKYGLCLRYYLCSYLTVNPRRACAARVTVSVCLSVRLLSHISPLEPRNRCHVLNGQRKSKNFSETAPLRRSLPPLYGQRTVRRYAQLRYRFFSVANNTPRTTWSTSKCVIYLVS